MPRTLPLVLSVVGYLRSVLIYCLCSAHNPSLTPVSLFSLCYTLTRKMHRFQCSFGSSCGLLLNFLVVLMGCICPLHCHSLAPVSILRLVCYCTPCLTYLGRFTTSNFRVLPVDFPFTQSRSRTCIRFQPLSHLDLNTWEDVLPSM